LEPLRQLDGDFDAIRASLDEYRELADETASMHTDLAAIRGEVTWTGDAAQAANAVVDVLLAALKWILAVVLFIIAIVLLLLAVILYAIGVILEAIGKVMSFVAAAAAVAVVILVLIRSGGRGSGNVGRLAAIWASLKAVFDNVYMAGMGTVGALADGLGGLIKDGADGVKWLALWLIEQGERLTGVAHDDPDLSKLRRERNRIYDN